MITAWICCFSWSCKIIILQYDYSLFISLLAFYKGEYSSSIIWLLWGACQDVSVGRAKKQGPQEAHASHLPWGKKECHVNKSRFLFSLKLTCQCFYLRESYYLGFIVRASTSLHKLLSVWQPPIECLGPPRPTSLRGGMEVGCLALARAQLKTSAALVWGHTVALGPLDGWLQSSF